MPSASEGQSAITVYRRSHCNKGTPRRIDSVPCQSSSASAAPKGGSANNDAWNRFLREGVVSDSFLFSFFSVSVVILFPRSRCSTSFPTRPGGIHPSNAAVGPRCRRHPIFAGLLPLPRAVDEFRRSTAVPALRAGDGNVPLFGVCLSASTEKPPRRVSLRVCTFCKGCRYNPTLLTLYGVWLGMP